ncbi:MAG: glycoside hydrolase family 9, partial [Puniceicoccaceae bacterium]
HPLLYAWRAHPGAFFGDDFGLPESGNGLPDLLDEIKFELDWLVKMQDTDGGVYIKMGNVDYNSAWPISADNRPRYYGPKCSASTLWTAAVFAHAARVYQTIPEWEDFAADLEERALRAWGWYQENPRSFNCDTGEIKSGIANRNAAEHDRMEAFAAIHLWILTGEESYHSTILQRVPQTRQMQEWVWSPYDLSTAEALLDYAAQPGAHTTLRNQIHNHLRNSINNNDWSPQPTRSLYRSWMFSWSYHWGSNHIRANFGIGALKAREVPGVTAAQRDRLRQRAADLLHHFHGVNPLGIVYLSNMGRHGAEQSVRHIWHDRFPHHSPLRDNPPPGYVVGGPNQDYLSGGPSGRAEFDWIRDQPRGKAFADFNSPWPGNSWEITENAIYYQAVYIRLLAHFVSP